MNYNIVLQIHMVIGAVALISFWIAALARKGGRIHRTAGKVYFVSILMILASVIPMIVMNYQRNDYSGALGLAFLFVMTFTATWIARRSISCKRDITSYKSFFFYGLASFLTLFGIVILVISIFAGAFLYGFFALTGLTLAGSMWHQVIDRPVKRNWYLSQHLNGVALLFAATHGSFLRFGLTKLMPVIPDTPQFNTISQTSMILLALLLRVIIGRRFLKGRSTTNFRKRYEPAEEYTS